MRTQGLRRLPAKGQQRGDRGRQIEEREYLLGTDQGSRDEVNVPHAQET